jgi:hypothetical protein
MVGRLHADICNVRCLLVPGVKIHVRLTKARDDFYLMAVPKTTTTGGTTTTVTNNNIFTFLEAKLLVNRVRSNPDLLTAHHLTLAKGGNTRLNITRVELARSSRVLNR